MERRLEVPRSTWIRRWTEKQPPRQRPELVLHRDICDRCVTEEEIARHERLLAG